MIMIDTLARLGVGAAIYAVMFLFIALTTRDTTIYDDCGEKEKSPNCVRMFMRGITFLMIEADAYLIMIKHFPVLKTIGISIFSYPAAIILALLVILISKSKEEVRKHPGIFVLFLIVLIPISFIIVKFLMIPGWI